LNELWISDFSFELIFLNTAMLI